MAHFAKLGVGNVVETIVVVSNDIATTEQAGVDFLNNSFKSWTLNETTCQWEPPVVKPTLTEEELSQGKRYNWNEETQQWELNE